MIQRKERWLRNDLKAKKDLLRKAGGEEREKGSRKERGEMSRY